MKLTIEGTEYVPSYEESLLQIVKRTGLDSEHLHKCPLAAQIAG